VAELGREVAQEAHVERRVVGHETQPEANSRKAGRTEAMPGESATIESVMPVSTAMNGGIAGGG
jgi:hypothetical protein